MAEGALFGLCNPLLDISALVPKELFDKYEVVPNNAILAEPKHLPLYAELVEKYQVTFIAGGSVQNTMRVAQWMLPTPQATTFVGCIGNDEFGTILENTATADKVRVHYMKTSEVPTGSCACLIDKSGERSLVANISAAGKYDISHMNDASTQELVHKAQVFYVSGFFLTVSPASSLQIAQHARETGKIFCMNLSAPFISQFFFEPLSQHIPYVDYLFGNESEALAFAAANKWETTSIPEIAQLISALPRPAGLPQRVAVITQGKDDTVVAVGDKVHLFPVTALDKIVDSNGAGDAFCGGFLAQLIQGKPLEESVRAAHYAAGVVLQHNGCSFPPVCDFQ